MQPQNNIACPSKMYTRIAQINPWPCGITDSTDMVCAVRHIKQVLDCVFWILNQVTSSTKIVENMVKYPSLEGGISLHEMHLKPKFLDEDSKSAYALPESLIYVLCGQCFILRSP